MKQLIVLGLVLILTSSAEAGMEEAKIALHVQAHTSKSMCGAAPTIPCHRYVTKGDLGVGYDVYLVIGNVPVPYPGAEEEIDGLSCGITYDPAVGQGVDVFAWFLCSDGLEFSSDGPNGAWPASGSGTRITWSYCTGTDIPPSGIHAVAGSFYVYAYSPDLLQVTENVHLQSGPELKIAECIGIEVDLPLSAAGSVAFSVGAVDTGYNPCTEGLEFPCQVPAGALDFGAVGIGGSKDFSVKIVNPGYPETPPIHGVASLVNSPDFTIVKGAEYDLPNPGDSTAIVVRFTPTRVGAVVCILKMDSVCQDVVIAAEGVLSPHPVVTPQELTLTLFSGASMDQTVEISNRGSAILTWSTYAEQGTLEEILAALDAQYASIIQKIPNRLDFAGGVTGNSIGGTNSLGSDFMLGYIPYSDGVIRGSALLGPQGRYFTRKYPGLFVFAADQVGINQFKVKGQLYPTPPVNFMDRAVGLHHRYAASVFRQWGDPARPSRHRILLSADLPTFSIQYYNQSWHDDLLYGVTGNTRLYYLIYMGANGVDIPMSAATEIAGAFLEVAAPDPEWLTTSFQGQLLPGESTTALVHISTQGLAPGTYSGHLAVSANSVHMPLVAIPLTLNVVDPPDIDVSGAPMVFDPTFVGDSDLETLLVANQGLAPLDMRAEMTGDMFLTSPESVQVPPNHTFALEVAFNPETAGSCSGTLILISNDPDEDTVSVALSGEALPPPELSMSSWSIHGVAPPGGWNRKTFLIGNTGANPLIFSAQGSEPWLCSEPFSGTVMPGQSFALGVRFEASQLESGDLQAELRLLTNDPSHRTVTVPVSLRVAAVDAPYVQVDPNTLNPGSHGHWATAYVELPAGDLPEEIVLETVLAQNAVPLGENGYAVGDFDQNGTNEVRFRFDRAAFIRALPPQDEVEAIILGEIRDRHYLVARDAVRVLRPHVVWPDGGEQFEAGVYENVTWESNALDDVDSVAVFFSPDGGQSWALAGISSGTSLAWQTPADPTPNALLKVEAYAAGEFLGYDVTDAAFAITSTTTGVSTGHEFRTMLLQNAPNPFQRTTHIAYDLGTSGAAAIDVFNIAGMKVRALVHDVKEAGRHEATWDGRDDAGRRVTPGIYVVRLRTRESVSSRRMLLIP